MPIFGRLTYSVHALERMRERGLTRADVWFALQHGEATLEEDERWYVDFGTVRIVLIETSEDTGHVVTVIRKRKHT